MFRPVVAIATLTLSSLAWADQPCSVDIHGTDQMTYDLTTIKVPASCKKFTVTLQHPGEMPKNVMGHNWVLTKEADMQAVTEAGAKAGEAESYIEKGDQRVLAHTKLIGGGEEDSVTLDTAALKKAGGPLVFFCSYPFHSTMMKGTLTLGG
ncbi:MAG: azurin [Janthinobacterium lividum]|uniref:azurin n=1 Tax=Pseudomonas sp. MWU16-30317 TaxID=2878095 RepID=UPI001CFBFBD9|nr:azurin [Pseudomonas sp. MWU16-30317]